MTTLTVHVNRSIDVGPVTLFSNFVADGSPENIVDETSIATAECPSGRCRVGFLADGRTLFIDGMTPTQSSARVVVRMSRNGISVATDDLLVDVLPEDTALSPVAIRIAGPDGIVTVLREYPTPDRDS